MFEDWELPPDKDVHLADKDVHPVPRSCLLLSHHVHSSIHLFIFCLLSAPNFHPVCPLTRQVKGHNGKPTMLSVLVKRAGAAGQGGAGRGSAASLPSGGAPPLTSGDKQEITERGGSGRGLEGYAREHHTHMMIYPGPDDKCAPRCRRQ